MGRRRSVPPRHFKKIHACSQAWIFCAHARAWQVPIPGIPASSPFGHLQPGGRIRSSECALSFPNASLSTISRDRSADGVARRAVHAACRGIVRLPDTVVCVWVCVWVCAGSRHRRRHARCNRDASGDARLRRHGDGTAHLVSCARTVRKPVTGSAGPAASAAVRCHRARTQGRGAAGANAGIDHRRQQCRRPPGQRAPDLDSKLLLPHLRRR